MSNKKSSKKGNQKKSFPNVVSASNKLSTIRESFSLLLKHPVLFVPKLFIAFLYGVSTLVSISLAQKMILLYSTNPATVALFDLQDFFIWAVILLVLTIFSYFVDLFFSGFYPVLVNHSLKGKINFLNALNEFKPKVFFLLLSGIILWLVITVVSLAEAFVLVSLNFSEASLVLSFLVTFVLIFLFYFLYPIVVTENRGLVGSFKTNFEKSFSNKKTVAIYSLIPFSVSFIKFIIAFFSSDPNVLIIFWVLVLLTGIVYTFHAVVNQILYLNQSKKKYLLSKNN